MQAYRTRTKRSRGRIAALAAVAAGLATLLIIIFASGSSISGALARIPLTASVRVVSRSFER